MCSEKIFVEAKSRKDTMTLSINQIALIWTITGMLISRLLFYSVQIVLVLTFTQQFGTIAIIYASVALANGITAFGVDTYH